ncbi:MAG: P1 family peptidase [Coprococcus sp.]
MGKKRIRDFGIVPGRVKTGERNAITDVPGVRVGHCTVKTEENHTGCNRDRSWTGQCICQALYGSCTTFIMDLEKVLAWCR